MMTEQTKTDIRAVVRAAMQAQGVTTRQLSRRIHERWVTTRAMTDSGHVTPQSAEQSLTRWLAGGRYQIPLVVQEAIFDELGLTVRVGEKK